ncbi:hypothetical protein CYMTET_49951 [Cymbomonas tetramitiformis]|uniref:Uncharacterized protein n=1 Tax=Cymbomonas tetramitiformis TaxID=36881 RepID=A0AAE0BP78_9CHLO|nr:hypothetical protein CYMTET_49951 [Cymbomonas tetramitiformis]
MTSAPAASEDSVRTGVSSLHLPSATAFEDDGPASPQPPRGAPSNPEMYASAPVSAWRVSRSPAGSNTVPTNSVTNFTPHYDSGETPNVLRVKLKGLAEVVEGHTAVLHQFQRGLDTKQEQADADRLREVVDGVSLRLTEVSRSLESLASSATLTRSLRDLDGVLDRKVEKSELESSFTRYVTVAQHQEDLASYVNSSDLRARLAEVVDHAALEAASERQRLATEALQNKAEALLKAEALARANMVNTIKDDVLRTLNNEFAEFNLRLNNCATRMELQEELSKTASLVQLAELAASKADVTDLQEVAGRKADAAELQVIDNRLREDLCEQKESFTHVVEVQQTHLLGEFREIQRQIEQQAAVEADHQRKNLEQVQMESAEGLAREAELWNLEMSQLKEKMAETDDQTRTAQLKSHQRVEKLEEVLKDERQERRRGDVEARGREDRQTEEFSRKWGEVVDKHKELERQIELNGSNLEKEGASQRERLAEVMQMVRFEEMERQEALMDAHAHRALLETAINDLNEDSAAVKRCQGDQLEMIRELAEDSLSVVKAQELLELKAEKAETEVMLAQRPTYDDVARDLELKASTVDVNTALDEKMAEVQKQMKKMQKLAANAQAAAQEALKGEAEARAEGLKKEAEARSAGLKHEAETRAAGLKNEAETRAEGLGKLRAVMDQSQIALRAEMSERVMTEKQIASNEVEALREATERQLAEEARARQCGDEEARELGNSAVKEETRMRVQDVAGVRAEYKGRLEAQAVALQHELESQRRELQGIVALEVENLRTASAQLSVDLQSETEERRQSERRTRGRIDSEVSERHTAIEAVQMETSTAIGAESDRVSQISSSLHAVMDQEVVTRQKSLETFRRDLEALISSEVEARRKSLDVLKEELGCSMRTESETRRYTHSQLSHQIEAEVAGRRAAMENLKGEITEALDMETASRSVVVDNLRARLGEDVKLVAAALEKQTGESVGKTLVQHVAAGAGGREMGEQHSMTALEQRTMGYMGETMAQPITPIAGGGEGGVPLVGVSSQQPSGGKGNGGETLAEHIANAGGARERNGARVAGTHMREALAQHMATTGGVRERGETPVAAAQKMARGSGGETLAQRIDTLRGEVEMMLIEEARVRRETLQMEVAAREQGVAALGAHLERVHHDLEAAQESHARHQDHRLEAVREELHHSINAERTSWHKEVESSLLSERDIRAEAVHAVQEDLRQEAGVLRDGIRGVMAECESRALVETHARTLDMTTLRGELETQIQAESSARQQAVEALQKADESISKAEGDARQQVQEAWASSLQTEAGSLKVEMAAQSARTRSQLEAFQRDLLKHIELEVAERKAADEALREGAEKSLGAEVLTRREALNAVQNTVRQRLETELATCMKEVDALRCHSEQRDMDVEKKMETEGKLRGDLIRQQLEELHQRMSKEEVERKEDVIGTVSEERESRQAVIKTLQDAQRLQASDHVERMAELQSRMDRADADILSELKASLASTAAVTDTGISRVETHLEHLRTDLDTRASAEQVTKRYREVVQQLEMKADINQVNLELQNKVSKAEMQLELDNKAENLRIDSIEITVKPIKSMLPELKKLLQDRQLLVNRNMSQGRSANIYSSMEIPTSPTKSVKSAHTPVLAKRSKSAMRSQPHRP